MDIYLTIGLNACPAIVMDEESYSYDFCQALERDFGVNVILKRDLSIVGFGISMRAGAQGRGLTIQQADAIHLRIMNAFVKPPQFT